MSKIITVCMAKGGVGKSVTSVNLSAALSLTGKKVLITDIDPQQGNATLSLGQTPSKLKYTIANIISLFLDLGQTTGLEQAIIPLSEEKVSSNIRGNRKSRRNIKIWLRK